MNTNEIQDAVFENVETVAGTSLVPTQEIQLRDPKVKTVTVKDIESKVGEYFWRQVPGFRAISENAGYSVENAFAESGMDWGTDKEPIFLGDGQEIPDTFAIRRVDTKTVLGIAGSTWKPVSNASKFGLLKPYLDNRLARIVGVGEINGGEKVTVALQISDAVREIRAGDSVGQFLTVTDHFNGRQGLHLNLYTLRLICTNGATQKAALGRSVIKHSRHGENRLADNLMGFEGVIQQCREIEDKYRLLASRNVPGHGKLLEYFIQTMELPVKMEGGKPVLPTKSENVARKLIEKFERKEYGLGQGSWYDAVQAVLEYRNHEQGRTRTTRLDTLLHGVNGQATQRDIQLALEMSA